MPVVAGTVADETYKRVLLRADEFFRSVMADQPQHLRCGQGCSLCCYGLFEIGAADIPLLDEGLSKLHPSRRNMIVRRARAILESTAHPNLRESLPREKDEFFERTATTPCPMLDDRGMCIVYEHRPLICRTFGLPLKDSGEYIGGICDLNFNDATDAEKENAAWDLQWEDELGPDDEYTIPEAVVLIARMRGW